MDMLPEEVILNILYYLSTPDLIALQSVSHRYLTLARDNALWKVKCFDNSQAEALRRRQQLRDTQDSRLAELRNAVTALPSQSEGDTTQLRRSSQPHAASDPTAEARYQRQRALANWDPAYPDEQLDYYEEYIHRHSPMQVGWLPLPKAQGANKEAQTTATGVGLLSDADGCQHAIAPLDDGSVCIWDVSSRSTYVSGGGGRIVGHSKAGLLSGQSVDDTPASHHIMTETGILLRLDPLLDAR